MQTIKQMLFLISLVIVVVTSVSCGKDKETLEAEYIAKEPQTIKQTEVSVSEAEKEQQKKEKEERERQERERKEQEQKEQLEKEETEKEITGGKQKSVLTGLLIDEEKANLRPYAIMINNIKKVNNKQSGLSEASILYEALVEGGITRLMGIFEDFSSDRIGSIRSARHYYASIADEYDAIFVHYGQTKYATSKIKSLGLDNLSGLESVGSTVYYRDKTISAPHNAFASYDRIIKGTNQKNYRTKRNTDWENHYTFYKKDTNLLDGQSVIKVALGFSNYTTPYFEYNKEEQLYERFQFGGAHIDASIGKQLKFKNIIIQLVKEWNIDKNGYQTMDIENASGKGYYITNGKMVSITWQKNETTSKMHYYDEAGNILKVNEGKTFIAVYPTSRTDYLNFTSSGEIE